MSSPTTKTFVSAFAEEGYDDFLTYIDSAFEFAEIGRAVSPEKAAGGGDEETSLSSEELELLAEIQSAEIELALIVYDCDGGIESQEQLFLELEEKYRAQLLEDLFGSS